MGHTGRVLKAGALYFAVAFAAGFALGIVRVLWAVPRFGTRAAELAEMPIMLVVIVVAARGVVRRLGISRASSERLGMGLVALALLLLAEFTLVLRVRGLSIDEYLAARDEASGAAYAALLVVFAVLPLVVARR